MAEVVRGTKSKLELISKTHGSIRVPLNQNFDYTPRYNERTIFEFDNDEAALVVTTFDGADVRFDYVESDSKLVDAMLNDTDPGATISLHDPSDLKEIQALLNIRGEDGKIFQSVLAKAIRNRGNASTEPVREEGAVTIEGTAVNVLRIKGAALLYTRILADTPDASVFLQGASNSSSDQNFPVGSPFKVTLDKTAEVIPGLTDEGVLVLKNGNVADAADYSFPSSTEFEVASAPAATDVWEVFTAYLDV